MNPNDTLANQKVVNKMKLIKNDWENYILVEFFVAPLKNYDTILEMLLLITEEILYNLTQQKVVLLS